MKIDKLKLTNWKHIDGQKELNFSNGLNIIVGPNFIGKTSILEALQYVLTGTFPAYKSKEKDKNWIHGKTGRSDLELSFEHVDKKYILRRSIKSRIAKGDVTEELLLVDENKNEISIARGAEVNLKINDFIPWDKYSVNKVAFMSDDIVNEINNGQKDLFKALKEVLSFKELQAYSSTIKSQITDLGREKDSLAKKLAEYSSSSTDADKQLSELEKELLIKDKVVSEKQKNLETKKRDKERIIAGKNTLEQIEKRNQELDTFQKTSEYKKLEEFDSKIQEHKKELESNQKDYMMLKEDYDVRKGRQEMLNQVLKLLQSSDEEECPVCNKIILESEKAELLHNHAQSKEKNEKKQVERHKELENKLLKQKELETTVQKLTTQKQLLLTLTTDLEKLTQGFDRKTDFRKEYEDIKVVIQTAEDELKEAIKTYSETNSKILKLKAELEFQVNRLPEQLKAITKEYHKKNLLKEVLDKTENDFILEMIESIKSELESSWLKIQSEQLIFDIGDQKGLNFKISRSDKELKIIELSGSERKMLILLIAVLLNKTFFNYPIITIDEPFEPLDNVNNEKLQNLLLELTQGNQIICTTVKSTNSITNNVGSTAPITVINLEQIWT